MPLFAWGHKPALLEQGVRLPAGRVELGHPLLEAMSRGLLVSHVTLFIVVHYFYTHCVDNSAPLVYACLLTKRILIT